MKLFQKKILKNSIFMYSRMVFTIIFGLVSTKYIFTFFGQNDYAIYSIALGLISLFVVPSDSAKDTFIRFFIINEPTKENESIFNKFFTSSLILTLIIILFSIILFVFFFLLNLDDFFYSKYNNLNFLFLISGIILLQFIIRILYYPFFALANAKENFKLIAIVGIYEQAMRLISILIAGNFLVDNIVISFLVFMVITYGISLLIFFIFFKKYVSNFQFEKKYLYSIIDSFKYKFYGSVGRFIILRGDILVTGIFFGPSYVSSLAISKRIMQITNNFVGNVQSVFRPKLIRDIYKESSNKSFGTLLWITKINYCITFSVGFLLFQNIQFFLDLWLNEYPKEIILYTRFIIIAVIINSISKPLFYCLDSKNLISIDQKLSFFLSLIVIILSSFFYSLFEFFLAGVFLQVIRNLLLFSFRLKKLKDDFFENNLFNSYLKFIFKLILILIITLFFSSQIVNLYDDNNYFSIINLLINLSLVFVVIIYFVLNKSDIESLKNIINNYFK